ncbi:MAG: type VI secretion system contractile sheath small subunit [Myxococcales bacterium]|nr:type VI secretion system contractile sheath small subunit [Myxococcales bacterium]
MQRETSVAPRERINITYRSTTEGAQEEVELPLRILVIGDYTGREDERPIEERRPVAIDKESFDRVLAAHDVRVDLAVDNTLDDRGGLLEVSLQLRSLADFRPEAIVAQVPELARLLEIRRALVALKGPLANRPRFVRAIERTLADPNARQRLVRELAAADPDADANATPDADTNNNSNA